MMSNEKSRKLREKAEVLLKQRQQPDFKAYDPANIERLIEELQIYQIELETQNEEMQRVYADLEQSTSRYTSLFDFAPIGYLTTDENDCIRELNLTGSGMLGIERFQAIGLPISKFIHPDYQDAYYFHLLKVKESDAKVTSEICIRNPLKADSQHTHIEIISIRDDSGGGIKSAFIDISKRARALSQLKENEERLNSLFQASPAGFWVASFGEILLVNERLCSMVGYTRDELIGRKTSVLLPEKEGPGEHLPEFSLPDNEGISLMVTKFRHKNGSLVDVLISSAPLEKENLAKGITFAALDITRQLNTEKALTEAELKFEMIASNANDGILLARQDGTIDYSNDAFRKLFGYAGDEVLSLNLMDLFASDDNSERLKHALRKQAVNPAKPSIKQNFELLGLKIDGSTFPLELSLSSFLFEGRLLMVAVIRDFSEHKLNQFKLLKAKEKAEESERLKTAFLANVSHEIRTPMNAILGFVSLMQEYATTEDERNEYFEMISSNGEVLLNLINDIIDLSKLESAALALNPQPVDLSEFMNEIYMYMLSDLKLKLKNNTITPKLLMPDERHINTLVVDRLRLRQVLINLINNAIKFTESGSVEIGVSLVHDKTSGTPMVSFYVKDTGIGIPADKTSVIFESFRQLEDPFTRKFGGAGLGLAIVKRIVEASGGYVGVRSDFGKGSEFFVRLPMIKAPASGRPETVNTNKSDVFNFEGRKILIVEDKVPNTIYLKTLLSKSKLDLLFAVNGAQAVEVFSKTPGIDLVLMDIQLPVMDGFEATARIKSIRKDVPVIAQTAFASIEDRERVFNSGFDDFVSKPINPKELLRKIAILLEASEQF